VTTVSPRGAGGEIWTTDREEDGRIMARNKLRIRFRIRRRYARGTKHAHRRRRRAAIQGLMRIDASRGPLFWMT